MHGCRRGLARLGVPSKRLLPVYSLAGRGCAAYEKGAACFAAAAKIPMPVQSDADYRKLTQAMDCGFAAAGPGSKLLAQAEVKGAEIKEQAG